MAFQKILDELMCFLRNFIFSKDKLPHKDNDQSVLTPTTIDFKEKAYKTVEDIAIRLDKMDAKNIAVTGPYGSGKSSVILTLRKDYPQYKYLHLSLATLSTRKREFRCR